MKAQKSFLQILLITWILAIVLAVFLDRQIQKSEHQSSLTPLTHLSIALHESAQIFPTP